MYVDVLNSDNYLFVNISLIKVLGLSGAAYCAELFNILKKAITKDKLVEDCYVKVDRDYIESRTGVSISEQKSLEDKWQKMDLINKSTSDEDNVFNINTEGFLSLIVGQESFSNAQIESLKKKLRPKPTEEDKKVKRLSIVKSMKEGLVCSNPDVREKMYVWIETMSEGKKRLSNEIVKNFLDGVEEYSQGNVSTMLKIIGKAIDNVYLEASYAINSYESDLKYRRGNPPADLRRATANDLVGGKKF